MKQTTQILDYIVMHEQAVLPCNISDMKLAVHRDASYPLRSKTRSRAGGDFLLSGETTIPGNNGAVLNIGHVIKHVMS